MATLFENYEQDYANLASSIHKKLNVQLASLTGDARHTVLRAVERELDEADEILHGMELELTATVGVEKSRLAPRLKSSRSDYDRLKAQFQKLSKAAATASGGDADREALLGGARVGGAGGAGAGAEDPQRSRLLMATHKLSATSQRLEDSHRVALETEEIGVSTLETLRTQREQLQRASGRLDETNSFVDRNLSILRSMSRRMATNRAMSIGIVLALVTIIILIIVIKLS